MTVRLGSLVASPDGEIDYAKIRSLVSVLLALAGGLVLTAAMTGLITPPSDVLMIGVGALVLPLTGGRVADAFAVRAVKSPPDAG